MTETITTSSTGGQKGVKPERHSLVPTYPLAVLARHYAFGAEKYDDHNWRKGYEWSKSYDALQRHAQAFWGGEDNDEEGQSHLAAVIFHAMSLIQAQRDHPKFDDRYKPVRPAPAKRVDTVRWDGVIVRDPWHARYATGANENIGEAS